MVVPLRIERRPAQLMINVKTQQAPIHALRMPQELTDWLTDWLINRLIDWLIERQVGGFLKGEGHSKKRIIFVITNKKFALS